MRAQFDGVIKAIAVDDLASPTACSTSNLGLSFTHTEAAQGFDIVMLENTADPLTCDTADKHWTVDYEPAGDRCTSGCVPASACCWSFAK